MTDLTLVFGPRAEGIGEAAKAARRSDRRFVRSAGQLAVYSPDRRPTGHVLTAWEAFDAFGIERLEEAVEYGSAILKHSEGSAGQMLKRRRKSLSFDRRSVARAASVPESTVAAVEDAGAGVAMGDANRVAFVLGVDERFLAFRPDGDASRDKLPGRLRSLQRDKGSSHTVPARLFAVEDAGTGVAMGDENRVAFVPGKGSSHTVRVSGSTALLFAEAESIIRIQHRLQDWLRIESESGRFEHVPDYGSPTRPAWKVGYELATEARNVLGLGRSPIRSMRALVEERLGIPVIQATLKGNKEIAGATVAATDDRGGEVRGIVLNTLGANGNVWVRRATLAHELGHLLFDPPERLENLRVDSYDEGRTDPQGGNADFVEQRANAFAVAFLAPNDAVRETAPLPLTADSVAITMRRFGIGKVAAGHHIYNSHYRQYDVPNFEAVEEEPSDEWKAPEDFTLDFFPLSGTPARRRGRFAYLAAKCCRKGLISEHTAAVYLRCSVEELTPGKLDLLVALYE